MGAEKESEQAEDRGPWDPIGPDDDWENGDGSKPNPAYRWEPGGGIPAVEGVPSEERWWEISFARTSRHLRAEGTDNAFAGKANRMIRANPMEFNEIGKEGWSYSGMSANGWWAAAGPKAALSLRSGAKKGAAGSGCEAARDPKTWAVMTKPDGKSRPSSLQTTSVSASRRDGVARISTTDNTVATKIRKAASAPGSAWVVWREAPSGPIRAVCPIGCVSLRAGRKAR